MYKILHCSDLHLERSFANEGLARSVSKWRRLDLRATLGRILSLAREQHVDAVTIAGDLYEQDYVVPDTAEFLAQQFAKLAPIRVFIAPGECDSYTNDSLYALTRWPENVTIFSEGKLAEEELAPEVSLWGAAHPPARGHKTLDRFRVVQDGVNLLLLHATDVGEGRKALFSTDAQAVHSSGFDFALLGHRHTARLWPEDEPYCAYPGSPEPLSAEEANGPHQVVLLTIQAGALSTEIIPVSQWQYLSLHVDLTGCESTEGAAECVEQSLQARLDSGGERTVCQVTLTGLPEFRLDLGALADQVETKASLRYKNQLAFPYDLDQLAQEQTVRGMLVGRFQASLEDAMNSHERNLGKSALLCALRSLDGKQVGLDEVR